MIKTINHVGISVADLDRSIRFYRDVFGMELVRQREFSGSLYESIMGLGRPQGRLAILQAGTARLELFEFSHPSPKSADSDRPVSDHGISHFCVEVGNVDQEYVRLKEAGVPFTCAPMDFSGIVKATYGRDPDGNVFELLERYVASVE